MAERTHCFLDISIGGKPAGRIIVSLYNDVVPKTANNFLRLCVGDAGIGKATGKPLTYKKTIFHRIIPGFMCQGGDFSNRNGTGGESIYGGKFNDESFSMKHSRPYMLSMANAGPNTNGSQFFITLVPTPHLNGKHVVFGEVIHGADVVKKMEMVDTSADRPVTGQEVVIEDCGVINTSPSSATKQQQPKGAVAPAAAADDSASESDSDSDSSSSSDRKKKSKSKSKKEKKEKKEKKKKEKKEKKDKKDKKKANHSDAKEVENDNGEVGRFPSSNNDNDTKTVGGVARDNAVEEKSELRTDARGNVYRGRGVIKYRGNAAASPKDHHHGERGQREWRDRRSRADSRERMGYRGGSRYDRDSRDRYDRRDRDSARDRDRDSYTRRTDSRDTGNRSRDDYRSRDRDRDSKVPISSSVSSSAVAVDDQAETVNKSRRTRHDSSSNSRERHPQRRQRATSEDDYSNRNRSRSRDRSRSRNRM